jgi:lipopolysaccharide transport system permease protein
MSSYETRIKSNSSWLRIDWRALWQFRDLLILLVRRDFLSKYSQTLLGPLWFVLQPLVTTLLFTVDFSEVGKIPTNNSPALLFYLSGMLPWNYFANTFSACSSALVANAGLFGKVYFPRLIVPISSVVANIFPFLIHLALVVVVYCIFTMRGQQIMSALSWKLCYIPLLLCQVGALGMGVGLWMSAITVKYRDFSHVSMLLLNVWFYATPVVFPLSIVPPRLMGIAMLNPMTFVEEAFRCILLGQGVVDPVFGCVSVLMTVVLLCSGILAFQRSERSFIDTV